TMAFQPIVDIDRREVYSYEALVRGPNGEGAADVLAQVNDSNRYTFDQVCRVKALKLGKRLGVTTRLDINFLPNALLNVDTCLRTTLRLARHYRFPAEQIVRQERSEEHTSELQSRGHLVCRLLLEKKKKKT